MRGFLCVVGLILLLTTLTEGSAFRDPDRKELKTSFIPALKKTDRKTPRGEYILIHMKQCNCCGFLVNYHFDTDECTEDCRFELQLTIELCKLNKTIDEVSFRDCVENHFAPDYVNKSIATLISQN